MVAAMSRSTSAPTRRHNRHPMAVLRVTVPQPVRAALERRADEHGVSLTVLARDALEFALQNPELRATMAPWWDTEASDD